MQYELTASPQQEKVVCKALKKAEENGFNRIITNGEIYFYPALIFSHDFAKAFWGNQEHTKWVKGYSCGKCGISSDRYFKGFCWQYHLQEMVLEREPVSYLERFL